MLFLIKINIISIIIFVDMVFIVSYSSINEDSKKLFQDKVFQYFRYTCTHTCMCINNTLCS